MAGERKPRCESIVNVEGWANMVAVQLHHIGFDLKLIAALVRKILVDRFGKPAGEGWICDEELPDCYKYIMVFSCADDGRERYTVVEVEEDENYFLWVSSSVKDERELPIREDGVAIPSRLEISVSESNDESNMFLGFVEEPDFEVEDE